MRLTFRLKFFIITGVAALGFIVLIATGLIITNRVTQQLERIQEQYIPLVELRPQLEANLEQLARAFQDAVATQDLEALGNASAVKVDFLKKLDDAGTSIDAATSAALRLALEEYFVAAHDVSLRLIREDTGLSAVDAMLDMQSKQTHVLAVLQQSTIFNKDTLASAFRQIESAMLTAANLRSGIAMVCLLAVILLSIGITRQMVRSLTQVRTGLWRFGQGNFTEPIETAPDEFGEVAGSANLMARRIQELLLERERRSEELEKANIMLAVTNKELEAFSYSVSHDLRAPLRAIDGFSQALLKDYGDKFDTQGHHYLERVRSATVRMSKLIDDMLNLSRISRATVRDESFSLTQLAKAAVSDLQSRDPGRQVTVEIQPDLQARGDARLVSVALENLIGNAWKFTSKQPAAKIVLGQENKDGENVFYIRDNGAGFDMTYSDKLFGAFQRLHSDREFEGTGIGLATVQRIINRHGGRIWAEAAPGQGATFFFTLGGNR